MADQTFKTCCALHNFLLDADGVGIPWEGSFKCEHDDYLFECCVPKDAPRHVHELHKDYGNLNDIDFATVGSNNLHAFEKNSTDENAEVESDDEEETNVQIPMDVHSTRNASDSPFDFFAVN